MNAESYPCTNHTGVGALGGTFWPHNRVSRQMLSRFLSMVIIMAKCYWQTDVPYYSLSVIISDAAMKQTAPIFLAIFCPTLTTARDKWLSWFIWRNKQNLHLELKKQYDYGIKCMGYGIRSSVEYWTQWVSIRGVGSMSGHKYIWLAGDSRRWSGIVWVWTAIKCVGGVDEDGKPVHRNPRHKIRANPVAGLGGHTQERELLVQLRHDDPRPCLPTQSWGGK